MHNTNGVLEGSGLEDGNYQLIPPRDRTPLKPPHQPEYSELSWRSTTLRKQIYGVEKGSYLVKHYVRKPHRCENCAMFFSSKAALREHMFENHSY
jgi:hypothetical protein